DGPTTSGRIPEIHVPQPYRISTSKEEFIGAIQMLTQLVAAQSGHQNSAPASFSSHDSGASRIRVFLRMNPPIFTGSRVMRTPKILLMRFGRF
ncbi:hypothetical protein HAX54_040317, partial [Datura stramonium]|nr:hypothetical protein [Datura stramonium]